MFSIKINNHTKTIDEVYDYFIKQGFETRPFFYTYYNHNHLKDIKCIHDLTINDKLNTSIIMIPSFPVLSIEEQIFIVNGIKNFLKEM